MPTTPKPPLLEKPSVPPRTNSVREIKAKLKETLVVKAPVKAKKDSEESDYIALSDCYSSKPAAVDSFPSRGTGGKLRRPLETVNLSENSPERRHTLNEEQLKRDTTPHRETYVNISRMNSDTTSLSNSETAVIDEQFQFLEQQDYGSNHSLEDSPPGNEMGKMHEIRKNLISGFIADQRDYVSLLETVVKYSKAIKSTLSSTNVKTEIISMADFKIIFGLIPQIYEIEKVLIDKLNLCMAKWSPERAVFAPLIGEKYAERMSLYGHYLRDYNSAVETATRCLNDSVRFRETCGEIIATDRQNRKIKKKFQDILHLPVLRLQATGLALQRIIDVTPPSHPDHSVLVAIKEKLRHTLEQPGSVPALEGLVSQNQQNQQSRQSLRPAVPVVEWIMQPSTRISSLSNDSERKIRYMFLFTDVIVACKRKLVRNRYQFESLWWFHLNELKINDMAMCKQEQPVKLKLESLSQEILGIRKNLLSMSRSGSTQSQMQNERKKLYQLEEQWLVTAPNVPLHLQNSTKPQLEIATTNESKILLFLSDFELGDWKRAVGACQMRLLNSSGPHTSSQSFTKDYLSSLCNEVAEKLGISHSLPSANPRVQHHNYQNQDFENGHTLNSVVASHINTGMQSIQSGNSKEVVMNSLGHQQITGQLLVTVHELTGLKEAKQCSVVLYVDCFGHFQIQAQTRQTACLQVPKWGEEFELDLNNSSALRIAVYSKEPNEGRDIIIGQSALQLTPDWLNKPFLSQPIGLLSAINDSVHLSLVLTIKYRPPHLTLRRRHGLTSTSLFGQQLSEVVSRDGSGNDIPRLVIECVRRIEAGDGLDQEGLYRISGLVGEVKRIRTAFEKDIANAREQLHTTDVNVAAGVLKSFFRELPDPLFTDRLGQDCMQLVAENQNNQEPDQKDQLRRAAEVLKRLPKINRKTAFFLLEHLNRVAERCDKNLMTAENLARIWGPTLLASPTTASGQVTAMSASTIYLQVSLFCVFQLNFLKENFHFRVKFCCFSFS